MVSWPDYKVSQTAQNLVDARILAEPIDSYPGDVPADLSTAYAVQSRAIKKWPDKLVGFKVGGIPERFRGQYPAHWLAGPIFKENTYHARTGETLEFPVFQNGFAAFEPELIFEIDSDVYLSEENWTPKLARWMIKRVWLGAEIASSPNVNVNALGPGSIISDFGNNGGCILGKELRISDLDRALKIETETRIDGVSVGKNVPGAPPDGPLGALAFLFNHLLANANLYQLPDTLLVSSGAISGVHESHVGAFGVMNYADMEQLDIRFVPRASIETFA